MATHTTKSDSGYHSLFWPMLLIGVGVIWLLANLGIIGVQNVLVAVRLWPLLLIIAGVDLLFGRRSAQLGAFIGIGTIALLVVLMLVGPSLGWGYNIETTTLKDSAPLEDATSAQVILSLNTGTANVKALSDSNQLITYDIRALGEVESEVTGDTRKVVRLTQPSENIDGLLAWVISWFGSEQNSINWEIGLSPNVPLDLDISNGTGELKLDLRDLTLSNLNVSVATGGSEVFLPANDEPYEVNISSATGGGTLIIPEDASLTVRISVATGGFTVDVPEGAAVQLNGSVATGGIDVPNSFKRVSGDDDRAVGDEGVWETDNYDSAARKINIEFDGATGGLTVK